jgi:dynein heavy chain
VNEQAIIMDLFERSFPALYQYTIQNLTLKMEVLEAFIITQACKLLEGLIPSKDDKETGSVSQSHYEHLYIFTLMWTIGAFLEWDDRIKVEEFLRHNDDITLDLPPTNKDAEETMFDYMVDTSGMCIVGITGHLLQIQLPD